MYFKNRIVDLINKLNTKDLTPTKCTTIKGKSIFTDTSEIHTKIGVAVLWNDF